GGDGGWEVDGRGERRAPGRGRGGRGRRGRGRPGAGHRAPGGGGTGRACGRPRRRAGGQGHLRRVVLQQQVLARPPGHRGQDRGDPAAADRQVDRDPAAGRSPPPGGRAALRGRAAGRGPPPVATQVA